MTYNEKKSLYENIMKDVCQTIKNRLNEKMSADERDKFEETVEFFYDNMIGDIEFSLEDDNIDASLTDIYKEIIDISESKLDRQKRPQANELSKRIKNLYDRYSSIIPEEDKSRFYMDCMIISDLAKLYKK